MLCHRENHVHLRQFLSTRVVTLGKRFGRHGVRECFWVAVGWSHMACSCHSPFSNSLHKGWGEFQSASLPWYLATWMEHWCLGSFAISWCSSTELRWSIGHFNLCLPVVTDLAWASTAATGATGGGKYLCGGACAISGRHRKGVGCDGLSFLCNFGGHPIPPSILHEPNIAQCVCTANCDLGACRVLAGHISFCVQMLDSFEHSRCDFSLRPVGTHCARGLVTSFSRTREFLQSCCLHSICCLGGCMPFSHGWFHPLEALALARIRSLVVQHCGEQVQWMGNWAISLVFLFSFTTSPARKLSFGIAQPASWAQGPDSGDCGAGFCLALFLSAAQGAAFHLSRAALAERSSSRQCCQSLAVEAMEGSSDTGTCWFVCCQFSGDAGDELRILRELPWRSGNGRSSFSRKKQGINFSSYRQLGCHLRCFSISWGWAELELFKRGRPFANRIVSAGLWSTDLGVCRGAGIFLHCTSPRFSASRLLKGMASIERQAVAADLCSWKISWWYNTSMWRQLPQLECCFSSTVPATTAAVLGGSSSW